MHRESYPHPNAPEPVNGTAFAAQNQKWRVCAVIADGVYVMSRPRAVGFTYVPLLLCSFRPDLTRRLVKAQRLYRQYPSYADADTAAARLRWCRLRAGLLQREVAAAVGIAEAYYTDLEHGKPDRLPAGLVDRLAAFYSIPADDLLDDYNRFLYRGPAQQLRAWKERSGLTWEAFCRKTGISSSSLSVWLRGKKRVSRASWEKYFKGNIEYSTTTASAVRWQSEIQNTRPNTRSVSHF